MRNKDQNSYINMFQEKVNKLKNQDNWLNLNKAIQKKKEKLINHQFQKWKILLKSQKTSHQNYNKFYKKKK